MSIDKKKDKLRPKRIKVLRQLYIITIIIIIRIITIIITIFSPTVNKVLLYNYYYSLLNFHGLYLPSNFMLCIFEYKYRLL